MRITKKIIANAVEGRAV